MKYFFLFMLPLNVYANSPYQTAGGDYRDRAGTVREITPNTPIKSQDGIGVCYGFSSTSLLEHYRCRELNLSCKNPGDLLSTLDVSSHHRNMSIQDGGETYRVLNSIERKLLVVKEECAQFSSLVHKLLDSKGRTYSSEEGGWNFLTEKWNEYKGLNASRKRNDCVSCLADDIKNTLVTVQTPKDQLVTAFNTARSLGEFMYKALLPLHCLDESKMAKIPPFKAKTYPEYKESPTVDSIMAKVESLLNENIPLEIGICTAYANPTGCIEGQGHSVALFGIKEVCSRSTGDCKKMVKIKNSYGQSWQNQNDDGWVDLRNLAEAGLRLGDHHILNWIENPTQKTPNLLPKRMPPSPTINVVPSNNNVPPAEYKNYKGIWKCPGGSYQQEYVSGCVPLRP